MKGRLFIHAVCKQPIALRKSSTASTGAALLSTGQSTASAQAPPYVAGKQLQMQYVRTAGGFVQQP
jgi:hypothetical protein